MLTAADHAIRRGKVTGSTAAAILGIDPFCSPLGAWLRITGRPEDHDEATRARFRRGHALEGALIAYGAEEIAADTGCDVAIDRPGTMAHPTLEWAACSLDAVYIATPIASLETPRVVDLDVITVPAFDAVTIYAGEGKTVDQRHAHEWGRPLTDEIPAYVAIQCTWELLHLPQATAVILPVLIGAGLDLRIYCWTRDAALEAACVEVLGRWHARHVEGDTPPDADPTHDAGIIGEVWRSSGRRKLDDDPRIRDLVRADVAARARESAIKAERDALKVAIGSLLRDADSCAGPWGSVTWKTAKGDAVTDWDAVNAGLHSAHPGAAGTLADLRAIHTTRGPGGRRMITSDRPKPGKASR